MKTRRNRGRTLLIFVSLSFICISFVLVAAAAGDKTSTSTSTQPGAQHVIPPGFFDSWKIAETLPDSELITVVFSADWLKQHTLADQPQIVKISLSQSGLRQNLKKISTKLIDLYTKIYKSMKGLGNSEYLSRCFII